ncbi:solute carrier family 35 member F4 isoform X2 [Peromyscus californicus insignis]|uniref:solute carrier family 35 member F4 isoform X2 n=1 Tax=Peromyscus californicus insignis TaxID=564181 RepID=UPI0022A75EE7|nr:solute carrier family 35 member F4 isoform X2 [Peromyscus californicus insignis]
MAITRVTPARKVPPDRQLLDANQDPTAPHHITASAGNCPLYLSLKILLLLFLNFRAEEPLEFVDTELRDRAGQIVAAIMAITGIVMMAYADNFHADSIIGVAFAVGSASTSALYKVLFKMFLGSANFGEAAHFVSTLAFFNLIFISFTPVILYFTKVEHWSSFAALPWGCLCGMAGLWLAFNILVNVGVVLTYPILISIGTVLSVPGNAAVDLLKQEVIFNVVRLAATIIICIGFLLMLLPEEWDEITLRFINSLKEKKSEEHVEDLADVSVHLRSRSRVNGTVSIPLA